MRTQRSVLAVAAAIAILALVACPAGAAPSVAISSADAAGETATVTGNAVFPPITAPQSVVGTRAANTPGALGGSAVGDAAGLHLTDATVQPLANGLGLRFRWVVADLPAQVPPEGVRYTWAFAIDGRVYQLQAKRTNLASTSTVEDPVGHVQHAAQRREFFQLRGACQPAYLGTPASSCYHLAFLVGEFDSATKTISVVLPYSARDSIGRVVAPDFVPGKTLVDNRGESTGGMTIAASFQAAVSNTATSRYINGIDPYFVGPRVQLGIGFADMDPALVTYTSTATLGPNDSFSGTVCCLKPAQRTAFVRACDGTECVYAQQDVP